MELRELEKELMEKNRWLVVKLSEQKDLVTNSAQTEHDYRVALAKKMMELRVDGEKVTIMPDLSRGDKVVAKLKLDRDIAKGMADSCRQAIRALQASMSGIQSMISARKEEMKLV